MNDAVFFEQVRTTLFGGSLSQPQVDGLNALLTAWGSGDKQQLAYLLGTALHETGWTMQPIAEWGRGAGHPYGQIDVSGKAPYGRGFCQLTFRGNYLRADSELGLNGKLAANYDLALQPDIAAKIIIKGMTAGWFTGRKLSDFIANGKRLSDFIANGNADYVGARAIVNGSDQAVLIAGYAAQFEIALTKAGYGAAPQMAPFPPTPLPTSKPIPFPPLPKPIPNVPPVPAKPIANGAWAELGRLFLEIIQAIVAAFTRKPK
jgi:hypothetical protein